MKNNNITTPQTQLLRTSLFHIVTVGVLLVANFLMQENINDLYNYQSVKLIFQKLAVCMKTNLICQFIFVKIFPTLILNHIECITKFE